FPAGLTGWGAAWNAGHFAGVDDQGELWSIWWAPGMTRWRVDSIGDAAGSPVLVGRPSAVHTAWDTFHINGVDGDGHVIATWWSGSTGWGSVDLTADFGGAVIEPSTITSGFSPALST